MPLIRYKEKTMEDQIKQVNPQDVEDASALTDDELRALGIIEMGCNEIMELNALKKIEGVPDDITK